MKLQPCKPKKQAAQIKKEKKTEQTHSGGRNISHDRECGAF